MKDSILNKLHMLIDRHEEVAGLLADPDVINDQNQFRELSQEYAQLEPVVKCFRDYNGAREDLAAAEEMMKDDDADVREMAVEEKKESSEKVETLEVELQKLLLPKDPNDDSNIFLEIRAGTGGDEAAIFAGDLFRMYTRYTENRGWKIGVITENALPIGNGYKEIILEIKGGGVDWGYQLSVIRGSGQGFATGKRNDPGGHDGNRLFVGPDGRGFPHAAGRHQFIIGRDQAPGDKGYGAGNHNN